MKIKVVSSSWSGERDYIPEEKEFFYEVHLNEKYTVKTRELSDSEGNKRTEDVFSFEITQVGDDCVSIHSFQPFSDSEKGVDLMSNKRDFTISIGKPVKLTSPTMDYADIFTLSCVE